ncbi:MAG TPA: hypothetical protein VEC12_09520 [Bacteroidia bacterium]|nr:hypothetical protein [Bacteroidia bacterium]
MKLLVIIAIGFFLLLGSASCKLDIEELLDSDEFFTIKGRLLKSCDDRTPLAHKNMRIDAVRDILFKDVIVPETHTDADGFFTFRYENEGHTPFLTLSIREKATNGIVTNKDLITQIPVFQNIELGDIFFNPEKPFVFELKTGAAFSSNDTLFYHRPLDKYFRRVTKFITGPFTNGHVFGRDTTESAIIFSDIIRADLDLNEEWILKSGKTIHKQGEHSEIFTPCIENKVIIDLTQ